MLRPRHSLVLEMLLAADAAYLALVEDGDSRAECLALLH